MAKTEHIPAPAIRRLSLYLRQLETFQANDRKTISSRDLGESLGLSDAQVRKDLAYFGQFGHPGIGYRVRELVQSVRRILGTDKKTNVLLVGCGNLGRALMSYRGFSKRGFEVVAVFDSDPQKIGQSAGETNSLPILSLRELRPTVMAKSIQVGIMCVPAHAAQGVADELVAAGIRGILNFAPIRLEIDSDVGVASVDLAVHLEQLAFQVSGVVK